MGHTNLLFGDLSFALPAGFTAEQAVFTATAGTEAQALGPSLNKQQPLAPNLSMLQRETPGTLQDNTEQLHKDLLGSDHKPEISTEDITFDDGCAGKLLVSSLSNGGLRITQYHAVRVDGQILTVLTMTDEAGHATALDAAYRQCIKSISPKTS